MRTGWKWDFQNCLSCCISNQERQPLSGMISNTIYEERTYLKRQLSSVILQLVFILSKGINTVASLPLNSNFMICLTLKSQSWLLTPVAMEIIVLKFILRKKPWELSATETFEIDTWKIKLSIYPQRKHRIWYPKAGHCLKPQCSVLCVVFNLSKAFIVLSRTVHIHSHPVEELQRGSNFPNTLNPFQKRCFEQRPSQRLF